MNDTILSWAIVLAIAVSATAYYGGFVGKKAEQSGTRGRTLSRTADTDWLESESKTKPTKAAKKGPRKSVKKAVQEVGNKAEAAVAAVASTTGAEAKNEPSLATKVANAVPSGKDVSDMLDPQIVPGVLKIGASEKPARPAKPQQQKSETQKQTKKQAQNAKKREAEKAAKAEAEVERKKLQEQQLRTARLARGEAPGARYQSSQPASNAWNNTAAPAVKPVTGQLLDTFDANSSASSATNGTAPASDTTSFGNLPSEEDQIAAALADSAWTEVPKGKKKKTKAEAAGGEGSDSGVGSESAPAPVKATPAPVPKKENKKEVKPASRYEVLSAPINDFSDPRDSDWPVV